MRVLMPVITWPAVGRDLAEDRAHQRRLAGAVRADDADAITGLEDERQVLEQDLVADPLADAAQLEDRLAEAATRGDRQLHATCARLGVGGARLRGDRGVEALDARLLLGAARLRTAADPVELVPDEGRALALARRLDGQALGLLLEKRV